MYTLIIYLGISIITSFFSYLAMCKCEKKVKYLLMLITILIPSICAGIRYGIGTDYFIYEKVFYEILNENELTKLAEFGYVLLNKICILLSDNYQFLVFIVSILTIIFSFTSIFKKKNDINVPIAIFSYMMLFYLISFNLSRQMLAASILMFALNYLEKNNIKKYIFFCIIACTIHTSAILGFGLIIINKCININGIMKKILYGILLFMSCGGYSLILTPFLKNSTKFYYYYKYFIFTYNGIGLGIFRYILMGIVPYYFLKKKIMNNNIIKLYFEIFLIGFILWLNSYFSTFVAYRMSYNFLIVLPILIGYYWKNLKNNEQIFLKIILLILIVFFWYYDFFLLKSGEVVPYITFLK